MHAVIVAHGEVAPADREIALAADVLIAADGGALHCESWGLRPSIVVGDLDSLSPDRAERIAAAGARVVAHPADKDRTDAELAVAAALEAGATRLTLVGTLGGPRHDHGTANLLLLADPRLRGRARIVHGATRVRALHGGDRLLLDGEAGDLVSLLAVSQVAGATTEGLRYALSDGALRLGEARGVSNVIERAPASLAIRDGVLLVFEVLRA